MDFNQPIGHLQVANEGGVINNGWRSEFRLLLDLSWDQLYGLLEREHQACATIRLDLDRHWSVLYPGPSFIGVVILNGIFGFSGDFLLILLASFGAFCWVCVEEQKRQKRIAEQRIDWHMDRAATLQKVMNQHVASYMPTADEQGQGEQP